MASLQRDMNSTLYILQELKNQLMNLTQEDPDAHHRRLPDSCSELYPNSQSGYYWLSGLSEKVYCDMDRQSCGCGNPWGWMRVAHIDMTDPNQQCPEGFRLRPATSKRMCEMTITTGCTSMIFPTRSVQYSRVCGRVKAYQYRAPDAFSPYYHYRSRTIDSQYVDGLSITHGSSSGHLQPQGMEQSQAVIPVPAPRLLPPTLEWCPPLLEMTISVTQEVVSVIRIYCTLNTLCGTVRGVAPPAHAVSSTPLPGSVRSSLSRPLTTLKSECAKMRAMLMKILPLSYLTCLHNKTIILF